MEIIEVKDLQSLKEFAPAVRGIAQLPYVNSALKSGQLVKILNEYAPSPQPINLLYPSQRLLSPTVKA
ncbi:LysR substrate-binding domain-containing protein [Pseudoalteromonas marina]|uniref:LysR substrate-binding domain-containing protein n=1 Tax=Pseudoalteromonas marina TaxID=267375 RepID=UPI0035C7F887